MRRNRLIEMFSVGEVAVNGWMSIPSAYSAEGAGHQGFDSVTVDLQHGMIGFESAVHMLQALSSTPAVPLVRVPCNDAAQIMHLLDAGAYGIICPMISTPEQAQALVQACRYPPHGTRSFGPARGLLYGGQDYFANANTAILAIPMIETCQGVDNIDRILAVDGIEMIYVGPNDLALDYGEMPGSEPVATQAAEAIAHVLATVRRLGKSAGIFCSGAEAARMRAEQGFSLVTPGNDFGILTRAMANAVQTVRGIEPLRAHATGY